MPSLTRLRPHRRPVALAAVALALLIPHLAAAQEFPQRLAPGETYRAPADSGSLFVLTRAQFEKAVTAAESLALCDSATAVRDSQITLLELMAQEQRGTIGELQTGYEHYRDLWTACDEDLEEVEVELDRAQRSVWKWSLLSAVVVGTAAFFVGLGID